MCYKQDVVKFTPELPQVKQEALAGLKYGTCHEDGLMNLTNRLLDKSIGAIYAKGQSADVVVAILRARYG